MRLIAFITKGTQIRKILEHIGVDSELLHISPVRGRPLWDDCGDAQTDEGCTLSQQIGTWNRKRHPTLRWISVSIDERSRRRR